MDITTAGIPITWGESTAKKKNVLQTVTLDKIIDAYNTKIETAELTGFNLVKDGFVAKFGIYIPVGFKKIASTQVNYELPLASMMNEDWAKLWPAGLIAREVQGMQKTINTNLVKICGDGDATLGGLVLHFCIDFAQKILHKLTDKSKDEFMQIIRTPFKTVLAAAKADTSPIAVKLAACLENDSTGVPKLYSLVLKAVSQADSLRGGRWLIDSKNVDNLKDLFTRGIVNGQDVFGMPTDPYTPSGLKCNGVVIESRRSLSPLNAPLQPVPKTTKEAFDKGVDALRALQACPGTTLEDLIRPVVIVDTEEPEEDEEDEYQGPTTEVGTTYAELYGQAREKKASINNRSILKNRRRQRVEAY